MNILLEDFGLPYEPARIFAKAESLFERLTECETAPLLFLDKEIEQTVRARSANYACLVMLMLMEIIRAEPMSSPLQPRSRYWTYLRGKFRVFNKEDILARWDELKEAEASATKRTQRTTTAKPAAAPQAHKTPASKAAAATPQQETPSAAPAAESGKCSLTDFVNFIISEGSADDCRRLKQMLQNYDYERENRYRESVKKLTTKIKQLEREDRLRMQAGNTYNISGGTVNNVGSTIDKQQNNRKYGE